MSNPSDIEALEAHLAGWKREIHTSFPAKVLAYDVAKQTVDVRPAIMRSAPADDLGMEALEYEAFPDIYAVQIMWPRAGGYAITFPINPGDWVEVSCAENSTMVWRQHGGAPSKPGYNDEHGLHGLVAKPGWFPDCQKLTNVNPSNLELRSDSGQPIVIGSGAAARYVALAELVENAIARAIEAHTHPLPPAVGGSTENGVLVGLVSSTAAAMVKAV